MINNHRSSSQRHCIQFLSSMTRAFKYIGKKTYWPACYVHMLYTQAVVVCADVSKPLDWFLFTNKFFS